jgi:uncharacterized hydrophobic protein (TIGR00271 family)
MGAESLEGSAASRTLLMRLGGIRRTLPELRDQLFLDIGDVSGKMSRFWILLLLSAAIATAGILNDSTATVIGAMIVAPLGTPIMGIALGVVTGDARRLSASFATVVAGALAVVVLSGLLAWILPQLQPLSTNGEITGRTSPSLIDLVAAVATGFAGAYGLARKDVSDVMPGVAIAISLVPPLSVVGITAAAGDWGSAWGAFLLFASNVVSMIIAGTIMFTLYGYHAEAVATVGFRKRRAYAVIVISLVVIAVPLTVTTVRTVLGELWQSRASSVAKQWAGDHGYDALQVGFEGSNLVVLIEGTGPPPPNGELLQLLRGQVPGGTPVVVNTIAGREAKVGEVPN